MTPKADDKETASLPAPTVSETISIAAPQQQVKNIGSQNSKNEETNKITIGQPSIDGLERADALKNAAFNRPASTDDVLTHTIDLQDDPSMPSITVRSILLGTIMSIFGAVLSAIYYFKPQSVTLTPVLLCTLSYIVGEAMSTFIPRKGFLGRALNPHPFNVKEHLAVTIMSSAASIAAGGIEIIAAKRLYYRHHLSTTKSLFLLLSSQFMGYGLAGLMRTTMVYPKSMLWPSNVPVNAMLQTLHGHGPQPRKSVQIFWFVFIGIFIWEIVPQWICPLLAGISVFCLANQHSAVFTYIFGGSKGNEGLGSFSLCFDWQYISGGSSPLYYPLNSLISQGLGICGCIIIFSAVYFTNTWDARSYPFLGQVVLTNSSTGGSFIQWNQTAALDPLNCINETAIHELGLPSFPASNVLNLLLTNLTVAAALTHVFLWHPKEMKTTLSFLDLDRLKNVHWSSFNLNSTIKQLNAHHQCKEDYDPHYALSLAYKACPDWWYLSILLFSILSGLAVTNMNHTALPWWAFFIALVLAFVLMITLGTLQAVTGVVFTCQSVVQMIGGFLHKGKPVANMYFSVYGYNSLVQGLLLARDLKLAQYGHLAPRVAFGAQVFGTLIGALFNYITANNIINHRATILRSIEGTNIWSGSQVQQFNAQSVTFGGLPHELFGIGGKYQWVTLIMLPGFIVPVPFWLAHKKWPKLGLQHINTAVVAFYMTYLNLGINSSLMMFFILGFGSQWWVRRRYPNLFIKYNYLVSAALDAGTSVMVFILSFAVFGAAGKAFAFPQYWGNNLAGNFDLCQVAS